MARHFDSELQDLRDGLMAMAGQVEEMIDLSRAAVSEGSSAKAEQVKAMDRLVDEQELKLDQACIDLLALRSPIATDLRLIASHRASRLFLKSSASATIAATSPAVCPSSIRRFWREIPWSDWPGKPGAW